MREIEFRAFHKGKIKNVLWLSLNHDELMFLNGINGYYRGRLKNCDLMQYTGLKDANGVKIFEGDIMQWHGDDSIVAVKWEQASCSYTAFGRLCAMHLKPDDCGTGHLLVIGNVYETPELFTTEGLL